MTSSSLRYGIIVESVVACRWHVECIRELSKLEGVELAVVLTRPENLGPQRSARRTLSDLSFRALWRLLGRTELHTTCDLRREVSDLPRPWECRTERPKPYLDIFLPEDIERIRAEKLDFILRFGFGILRGEILESAKYGVWSFHHGDEREVRGRPPGFWEITQGLATTGAILQRLTPRLDGGVILRRGRFRTLNYSWRSGLRVMYAEALRWPAEVCRQLLRGDESAVAGDPSKTKAKIYSTPTFGAQTKFVARIASGLVGVAKSVLRRDDWSVVCATQGPTEVIAAQVFHTQPVTKSTSTQFYADPFVFPDEGCERVFAEVFDHVSGLGRIATRSLHGDEPWQDVDLGLSGHLSFPYVFTFEGKPYMVPEAASSQRLQIYAPTTYPTAWHPISEVALGPRWVDPVVFEHGGKLWLLATDMPSSPPSSVARLHAWSASHPEGEWSAHGGNPIVNDIVCGRNAGRPFRVDGQLIRPAQDLASGVPKRIVFRRVDRLDEDGFSETTIGSLEPADCRPVADGVHTLDWSRNGAVFDLLHRRYDWRRVGRFIGVVGRVLRRTL